MSAAGLNGIPGVAPAAHGSNGAVSETGGEPLRARKKSARLRVAAPAPSEPALAPFAAMAARPADTPIWPIQPVIWWQPELQPALPASSGLTVERRHKVPAPDFLPIEVAAAERGAARAKSCVEFWQTVLPPAPRADLVPLGWDPRAEIAGKEGSQ